MDISAACLAAYLECEPAAKCALVRRLPEPRQAPRLPGPLPRAPGRPESPVLVHPADVPRRKLGSTAGRAVLVHAIAHIEFNAINLALDAMLRFPDLPLAYYRDWLSVARDEARHFEMLAGRLQELNSHYGAHAAHNGLWEMAEKTAHDPLLRMALVPRVLEARGLDVTPGMIRRLGEQGDQATVAILEQILAEEVAHVAVGSRWFGYLCALRELDSQSTFVAALDRYLPSRKRGGELNLPAREIAGFGPVELAAL